MSMRTVRLSILVLVVAMVALTTGRAFGIGFILGESKDELKLKYDVSVTDHGTGRVTVVLTLADEGRLAPLEAVELVIPAQEKNADGSYWMDLVVSIDMAKAGDGRRVGRVHLLRSLAERAEIRLNTHTKDGKLDPMTRLHHVIPLAKYLNETAVPAAAPTTATPAEAPAAAPAAAPPASERKKD